MIAINKKIGLYCFITITLGLIIYLWMFYLSVIDTTNVKLEGYIFDKETKDPVQNVLVIINNERYEDDEGNKNYDEYLGHDIIKLYSDKNGYYSTTIKKSAFLWIDFDKNGYCKKSEEGEYSGKVMNYKTYLTRKP